MFEKPNIRWTDGQTDSFWGWGGREAPQNFIADFENCNHPQVKTQATVKLNNCKKN